MPPGFVKTSAQRAHAFPGTVKKNRCTSRPPRLEDALATPVGSPASLAAQPVRSPVSKPPFWTRFTPGLADETTETSSTLAATP